MCRRPALGLGIIHLRLYLVGLLLRLLLRLVRVSKVQMGPRKQLLGRVRGKDVDDGRLQPKVQRLCGVGTHRGNNPLKVVEVNDLKLHCAVGLFLIAGYIRTY